MRASAKVLSLILAAAGLLSLVGGGMSLKDVSTAKSYWEEKGVETDENLGKLEDGLTQLKDKEEDYLEGREALAQGKADFADGQEELAEGEKAYADGQKLLEEKQKE